MPNVLCLLLHLIFTATLYGRSSSSPSFTDKKLRPREAKELSGGHRCQVGTFVSSHCLPCLGVKEKTGAGVKSQAPTAAPHLPVCVALGKWLLQHYVSRFPQH